MYEQVDDILANALLYIDGSRKKYECDRHWLVVWHGAVIGPIMTQTKMRDSSPPSRNRQRPFAANGMRALEHKASHVTTTTEFRAYYLTL